MIHCHTDIFITQDDGSVDISHSISLKLCDFGVATIFDGPSSYDCSTQNLTVENEIWQAPQIQKGDEFDACAADMYVENTNSLLRSL